MMEAEAALFTKHYRYKTKTEEGFIVRYTISNDSKLDIQVKKQEHKDKSSQMILDKQELAPQKPCKRTDKKVQMTKQSLQELRKYSNVNLKNIRIVESAQEENSDLPRDKKKKYKKIEKEARAKDEESEEQKYKIQKEQKGEKNEKRSVKFNSYTDLKEIEQSRRDGNHIFFKGRIEFGQQNKSRGRIYCEERQGQHVAQGDNCNRAIHEDQIYFKVLKEDGPKTFCHVVGIIPSDRQVVGRVQYFRQKNLYILNPINPRIASMNIETASSKHISKGKLNSHYYLAHYKGWNQVDRYPTCEIIKQFGKFGDIDVETSSLLKNHNIVDAEYDQQQVRRELAKFLDRIDPINGQYLIPEEEITQRQDLRDARIFTIDPLTARDFDDALSIQKQGDGYEVGVHIADASFFVEQDSFVDKQAKLRTTSVYLVHRVLPMLPRVLCENLCSLNPGCERLTFTLWIKIDAKGIVMEKPRISRSVIRSQARFTYEQAQLIIEGKINSQEDMDKGFGCVNPMHFAKVASDIKLLDEVAKLLRAHRIERGSLFFDIPRKVFKLDKDLNPISSELYERKQAHFLVEQLMILANQQVGEILVQNMGPQALLRRHKYPGPRKIQRFQQFMRKIKMPITMSETVRVQDQVNEILSKSHLKQSIKDIVKYEMINLLEAADYFLVGSSAPQTWIHYALNSSMYTHFTSPIRRYPDILVHRQLASIIKKQNKIKGLTKDLIDLCNQKKLQAKRVSNGCEKIFFCLYLRKNEVVSKAIIMDVEEWGIKLCVPKYDFKGTLRFKELNQLKKIDHSVDQLGRKAARLQYATSDLTMKLTLKDQQQVQIRLSCKEGHPLDYKITLLMPNPKLPGQHLSII